jgi:hypothetical protein
LKQLFAQFSEKTTQKYSKKIRSQWDLQQKDVKTEATKSIKNQITCLMPAKKRRILPPEHYPPF